MAKSKWADFGSLDGRLPGIPKLAHVLTRVAKMHYYRIDARAGTWRHLSEPQPLYNSMLSSTIAETNRPTHPGQVKMG